MSLFTDYEICVGCRYATFYDCGHCLVDCAVSDSPSQYRTTGKCVSFEAVDDV